MRSIVIFFILACLGTVSSAQFSEPGTGKIDHYENFRSAYIKARNIDVWKPSGYSPSKKYAVLYMHDGQNLFDTSMVFNHQEWHVEGTLDSLMKARAIRDCIVVAIWNTERRRTEYFPARAFALLEKDLQDSLRKDLGDAAVNPESDGYLKFVVEELKPAIDSLYPTLSGRDNTFIAGSSMGGLISLYAICEYPDVFGGAACISTHWPGSVYRNDPRVAKGFKDYLKSALPGPANHKFYFDYGTESLDSWYEPYQQMIDSTMIAKGYNSGSWITRKFPGAIHDENSWRKRFSIPMLFLMKRPD